MHIPIEVSRNSLSVASCSKYDWNWFIKKLPRTFQNDKKKLENNNLQPGQLNIRAGLCQPIPAKKNNWENFEKLRIWNWEIETFKTLTQHFQNPFNTWPSSQTGQHRCLIKTEFNLSYLFCFDFTACHPLHHNIAIITWVQSTIKSQLKLVRHHVHLHSACSI